MKLTQGLLFRSIGLIAMLLFWTAGAQAEEMISVNREEIHMRAGPGTTHRSQWMLSRGYPLQVLAKKGGWLKVRDFESDEGWVFASLTTKKAHMVVKAQGKVNMRSGPGTRYSVAGKVQHGEVLQTLAHKDGWVQVQQRGGPKGWVLRKLLWGW